MPVFKNILFFKNIFWAVLFYVFVGGLSYAAPPPGISQEDYAAIESMLQRVLTATTAGEHVQWKNRATRKSGVISPGHRWKKSVGPWEKCQGRTCTDPCRNYTYTYKWGANTAHYKGTRCYNQKQAAWMSPRTERLSSGDTPPPLQTVSVTTPARLSPPKPQIDLAMAREIQKSLKVLMYYNGTIDGAFGKASYQALQNFIDDEQLDIKMAVNQENLTRLQLSMERSSTKTTCPLVKGRAISACGIKR